MLGRNRAYTLNDNRLHSMLLIYLSSQVFRMVMAGHIVNSDMGALLRELDTDQLAQAPELYLFLANHEVAIIDKTCINWRSFAFVNVLRKPSRGWIRELSKSLCPAVGICSA
jgi:hypothetical protein